MFGNKHFIFWYFSTEPPLRKKAKTPRKKIKPKSSALPEIKAEELSNIDDIDGVDDDDDDLDIDADTGFDIDDDDIEEDEEFKVSDPESDPEEVPRVPGAGWADAMAKILQREIPKESPSTSAILSKSKEYEKAKLQEEEEYAKRNKVVGSNVKKFLNARPQQFSCTVINHTVTWVGKFEIVLGWTKKRTWTWDPRINMAEHPHINSMVAGSSSRF